MINAYTIIQRFGGPKAVATEFKVSPSAPHNWRHDGIPAKFWHDFVAKAQERGIPDITFDTLKATKPPRLPKSAGQAA